MILIRFLTECQIIKTLYRVRQKYLDKTENDLNSQESLLLLCEAIGLFIMAKEGQIELLVI